MDNTYMELATRIIGDTTFRCPVCGYPRYVTNACNGQISIHCSSREAKFWECPSGSLRETIARQHWDQSGQDLDIHLTQDPVFFGVAAG